MAYLSYILASLNFPFADDTLILIDRGLGIEFRGLLETFGNHSSLMEVMNGAYASIGYQSVYVLPALLIFSPQPRCTQFVLAWSLALSITVLISPFVPAEAAFIHLGLPQTEFSETHILTAWTFADSFYAVRDGSLKALDLSELEGIITFPSFHAAAAILFAWSTWRTLLLRWPSIALNVAMWISAIPVGGHYVIDIIAGSLIALTSILAVEARIPALGAYLNVDTPRLCTSRSDTADVTPR